jgi:hypothetical protein
MPSKQSITLFLYACFRLRLAEQELFSLQDNSDNYYPKKDNLSCDLMTIVTSTCGGSCENRSVLAERQATVLHVKMLDPNSTCKSTCKLSDIIEPRSALPSIGGFFVPEQFSPDMENV